MCTSSEHPQRPRYVPERSLPPYAYVPGGFPHPVRDPEGHMFGRDEGPPEPLDPANWRACREYLYGIDLFNHGYYWEAHEVWEGLWHACGRSGAMGDFLQGLIKLAAAGVKAREGNPNGVRRHARRAAELFRNTQSELSGFDDGYWGFHPAELAEQAEAVASDPPVTNGNRSTPAVEVVFPFVLQPVLKDCE